MLIRLIQVTTIRKVLENELGRSYKQAKAHGGRGPKVSGRPRTMSVHAQTRVSPHQPPDHLIRVLRRHAEERPRHQRPTDSASGSARPLRPPLLIYHDQSQPGTDPRHGPRHGRRTGQTERNGNEPPIHDEPR